MNEKLKKVLPCKIYCKTEDNYQKVLKILDKEGFIWIGGRRITTGFEEYHENLFLSTNLKLRYCSSLCTCCDQYNLRCIYGSRKEISLEQFFSFFKPAKSQKLLNLEKAIKTKLKRMDWDEK